MHFLNWVAAGCSYSHTGNAAIPGFNTETLEEVSVQDCKAACCDSSRSWCNSFDYYKTSMACDLSDAPSNTKLNTDWPNHPYDHYSKTTDAAGKC